jgi:hypothetical protein
MSVYLGYFTDKIVGIPKPIREKNKGDGEKTEAKEGTQEHDSKAL